jgi:adenine deaminase
VAAAGVFAPPAFYTGRDVASWMVELPVVDGSLAGGPGGVSKVGVVERHRATGNVSVGFQRWGVTVGAIASSMMHDSHNIVVVGADDADMAMAVNQVAAQDGGMSVVRDGKVLAAVALPVWGLMSDAPVPETLAAMESVEAAGRELCNASPEIRATLGQWSERIVDAITFGFLTCHPRQFVLTDQGWFDMADQSPMALPVG